MWHWSWSSSVASLQLLSMKHFPADKQEQLESVRVTLLEHHALPFEKQLPSR